MLNGSVVFVEPPQSMKYEVSVGKKEEEDEEMRLENRKRDS